MDNTQAVLQGPAGQAAGSSLQGLWALPGLTPLAHTPGSHPWLTPQVGTASMVMPGSCGQDAGRPGHWVQTWCWKGGEEWGCLSPLDNSLLLTRSFCSSPWKAFKKLKGQAITGRLGAPDWMLLEITHCHTGRLERRQSGLIAV